MTYAPVSGLLYVKVPALGRKRGLPSWKVWKDFWVTAKQVKTSSNGRGLQLNFAPIKFMHSSEPDSKTTKIYIAGGSTIRRTSSRSRAYVFAIFPPNSSTASIYLAGRSESESQRWIYDFITFLDPNFIAEIEANQFEVTTLPGPLSAELGLSGLMARLGVRNSGVALREPSRSSSDHQGKLLGAWGWRQIDHARCRLAAAALPEDDGKICVIRTTSLFPGGAGDLTVFCTKGRQLVRALQNKTANLLSSLHLGAGHRARRMSRSEGDLRFVFAEVASKLEEQKDTSMGTSLPRRNTQLASSLMSVGMRLAVPSRARCHSESTREQRDCSPSLSPENNSPQDNSSIDEDNTSLEDIGSNENLSAEYMSERRRVSNVSVASGVYETIDDGSDDDTQVKISVVPPPLPPREYKQRHRTAGGLHAFFRIQRLWRSNSENHVAKEEDEYENDGETNNIYSEVLDPKNTTNKNKCHLQLENHQHLSNSCSNLPNKTDNQTCDETDSNCNSLVSCDDESLYMPMNNVCRYDRHRVCSESGVRSAIINVSNISAVSDDSIYVTMNSDRKASLTSEIYALVTGLEPTDTSSP